MAIRGKKRYRLGGDLSVSADADGLPRRFTIGDEMPDDVLAGLSRGEVEVMLGNGMLREIGAPPAPKAAPSPPPPPTVAEVLRQVGWPRARVVDGQVQDGPRGHALRVLDRPARESDLKELIDFGGLLRDRPVVVHRVDGQLVASIELMKLAQLLAGQEHALKY